LINAPLEHRVGRTAIIRGRRPERPVCAKSGLSLTAWRTGEVDPLLPPFKITGGKRQQAVFG
jgi:hypothetical protein